MLGTSSKWVDSLTWKERWEKIDNQGGGGQGEAWRARRKSDQKIGFLKIIKSKKALERRTRFYREASAYDSFGIDGIPALIESNAHFYTNMNFIPYIAIEFISGKTLRSWCEIQEMVSLENALKITLGLLNIIQKCHAQGCVHRDIKPDNIILENDDPSRVWLLDFGISYHNHASTSFQTEDGQEIGNRFLRLPELSAGSLAKQDPRSDISFAAGILFYLLTGEHPDILQDSSGRLPHQRSHAFSKLQQVAASPSQRSGLLSIFDEAFDPVIVNRFSSTHAMQEKLEKIMQDQSTGNSVEANLDAIRETLDTSANRRRKKTIRVLDDALRKVQNVFDDVQSSDSIGGNLSISQTNWNITGEKGENTLFWTQQGSSDKILSVHYEIFPTGDELVIRMNGENIYRTDLIEPSYGVAFFDAIKVWLTTRLRIAICDPNTLPPEADIFKETKPFGSLEDAAIDAERRNLPILAFVYDPSQPERGKLEWALGYFLENKRTRDIMNGAFVTALIPLSEIDKISDILNQKSMERSRWLILNRQLKPLQQDVIHANPQGAEKIIESLAEKYMNTN